MNKQQGRTFTIGDIHGAYIALAQVLKVSNFDFEHDKLIVLGDVADGYPETDKCIDLLLTIKNLVNIRGNHDQWLIDTFTSGLVDDMHWKQGGQHSIQCYLNGDCEFDKTKVDNHMTQYFDKQVFYHVEDKSVFVHGGFDTDLSIHTQDTQNLMWGRNMTADALFYANCRPEGFKVSKYDMVYVGHTPTINYGSYQPITICGVTNMDTGAGYGYRLSMMNIHTKELYCSDNVSELYPNHKPRH